MSDDTPTLDRQDKKKPVSSPADNASAVGFVGDASVLTDPAMLLKARKQVAATAARQASTSLVEYQSAGQCLVIAKDKMTPANLSSRHCNVLRHLLITSVLCFVLWMQKRLEQAIQIMRCGAN